MPFLLTLAAFLVVSTGLAGAGLARWLARRDHRCVVVTKRDGCDACARVIAGTGRGGHVVCACGASSPHLAGVDLLTWRATHYGEALPGPDGTPAPAPARAAAAAGRSTTAGAGSHTRVHAAEVAETDDFIRMMEERSEAERRSIERARRNPNPITPQLLREAGFSAGEAEELIAKLRAAGELD